MGGFDISIGKQSSDAPASQQSEEYAKSVESADTAQTTDLGTGAYQGSKGVKGDSSQDAPVSTSKYGDPNAGLHAQGQTGIQHLPPGRVDNRFYGHYLPEHFKKTSIINTKGRTR